MDTHRFNGVPINLDSCSTAEIHSLRRYANVHLQAALGEVACLNRYAQAHEMFKPLHPVPDTSFERDTFIDAMAPRRVVPPIEAA